MKFSDEELSCIADDSIENIEKAINDLEGVKEYEEIKGILEDIKIDLLEKSNPYRENYYKQCEEERKYEEIEYQRSRL